VEIKGVVRWVHRSRPYYELIALRDVSKTGRFGERSKC
jgi:hypothetical protein